MKHTCWNGCLAGALALVLSTSAWGQNVHVVAGDGSGDFLQLQAAVTAAANGDVILVRPHTERYDFTDIDGKALTIVGDGAVRPGVEDVRVRHLAAGQVVTLRFLDVEGRSEPFFVFVNQEPGLRLTAIQGCVWLEDLLVSGGNGMPKAGGNEGGLPGIIVGSARVVGVDCEVEGGFGAYSIGGTTYPGGRGAQVTASQLALHGCAFVGGEGSFESLIPAARGGIGIDCKSSTLFASGSSLIGGDTGPAFQLPPTEPSAPGLLVRDGSSVNHLATTFESGGGPAPPGVPIDSSGSPSTVVDLDDDHRRITIGKAVREQASARVTYSGQPGDLVLLEISPDPDWTFVPGLKGVLHHGAVSSSLFLGVADHSGALGLVFTGPSLPPGVEAVTGYAQPLVGETDGSLRLGAPSSILLLDRSIPRP